MEIQGVKVTYWDVFELPETAFGFDSIDPNKNIKAVDPKWCLSKGDVFHLSMSARVRTGDVVVKTVCLQHLVQPAVVKNAEADVALSLANMLVSARVCPRCARKYPHLISPIEGFLLRMDKQLKYDADAARARWNEDDARHHFQLRMNEVIEQGIAEYIDTPLKDLDFGDLTLRDLLTAFDGARWYHVDLVRYAEYYASKGRTLARTIPVDFAKQEQEIVKWVGQPGTES